MNENEIMENGEDEHKLIELDKVRTICQARELADKHKYVVFKYPAHATDPYSVADIRLLEWMRLNGNPLSSGNAWEHHDPEKIDEDHLIRYLLRFTMSLPEGADMVTTEKYDWCEYSWPDIDLFDKGATIYELNQKTRELQEYGITVAYVEYGSPLHHMWLGWIGD